MSALPRFFVLTAIAGLALWLGDMPYPFPLLGVVTIGASIGGFLFSCAYVHEYMPQEWARKTAPLRRLRGGLETSVRAGERQHQHRTA